MEQPHSALPIALSVAATYSIAAVIFAAYSLSPLGVALCLPGVLLVAAMIARAIRATPPTLSGVRIGTQHRRLLDTLALRLGMAPPVAAQAQKPRFVLVAMPINHYGEKVRWILDLLSAPYEEATVGGLISAFLHGRSVPSLVDRQSCSRIGNSDECLAFLSAVHVPTMATEGARARAEGLLRRDQRTIAWEPRLNELGHLVQGWAYYYVLATGRSCHGCLTAWGAFEPRVPLGHRAILLVGRLFFKQAMRAAFDLSSDDVRDRRRRLMDGIFAAADAALEEQAFLTGPEPSYVDIAFCSLVAPLLASSIVFAQPSRYANGRFASFSGAFERLAGEWPRELMEFEQHLANRPCGRFVERMYREWRGKRLV